MQMRFCYVHLGVDQGLLHRAARTNTGAHRIGHWTTTVSKGIYQELDKRPTVFFSTRHDGVLGEYGRHERGYQIGQVAVQNLECIPSRRPVDIEGFTV